MKYKKDFKKRELEQAKAAIVNANMRKEALDEIISKSNTIINRLTK
jgi:hypothetical protein